MSVFGCWTAGSIALTMEVWELQRLKCPPCQRKPKMKKTQGRGLEERNGRSTSCASARKKGENQFIVTPLFCIMAARVVRSALRSLRMMYAPEVGNRHEKEGKRAKRPKVSTQGPSPVFKGRTSLSYGNDKSPWLHVVPPMTVLAGARRV